MSSDWPSIHLDARDIPVPTTISAEAQVVLSAGAVAPPGEFPPLSDLEGWRKVVAERDEMMLTGFMKSAHEGRGPWTAPQLDVEVEEISLDDFRVYILTPEGVADDDPRVYLELHGGGFVQFAGEGCRRLAIDTARIMGAPVWAVDYRMPPDYPYPVPLDDCVATYRRVLEDHRPSDVIIGGPSAGGNLALACILRARDEGLPLPAAAVVVSPDVDLTGAGDTHMVLKGLDPALSGDYHPAELLYANGQDLSHPYLSPINGDYSKGFPPTILTSGTRDLMLSDTVRVHRAMVNAGVAAQLHVWEAAGHAMFFRSAPEDGDHMSQLRRFADEHWSGTR